MVILQVKNDTREILNVLADDSPVYDGQGIVNRVVPILNDEGEDEVGGDETIEVLRRGIDDVHRHDKVVG
ncbi:predicted protein [Sclerotinia sclerotiorum 1980 UF-70]|uniref:Uncharacterized protein n=1 Tax=Sclerotinia sclerotiorum (strain ATCC 18683 / 1980 / Ss-1) TaxID=665079 RepID=A7EE98_SCLS1|nr:predicted protein [Sclerotinia sclerotiorum 1980 UF-70]EDO01164.1 predicted protein [Sclerotinia sclerotiorum 1980 UF-70]